MSKFPLVRIPLLLGILLGTLSLKSSQAQYAEFEPLRLDGNVQLTLARGIWKPSKDQKPEFHDLTLDLVCENNQCQPQIWGYSPRFNLEVEHPGTLIAQQTGAESKFRAEFTVYPHPWQTERWRGKYRVTLVEKDNKIVGNYRGQLNGRRLQGSVQGRTDPRWPRIVKSQQISRKTRLNHPRLIFPAEDLPALQQKASTSIGQEILSELNAILQTHPSVDGYVPTVAYHAAGQCFLAQLNRDKSNAETGWSLTQMAMRAKQPRLLEQAPIVAGTALAFDLCYEFWEPDHVKTVTQWLGQQATQLVKGNSASKGWNGRAWSNWSVRTRSAAALALLAIEHEPPDYQHQDKFCCHPEQRWLLYNTATRSLQRYMTHAIGDQGLGIEGDHYTVEPWKLSFMPFLHATRQLSNEDWISGSGAENILPFYISRFIPQGSTLAIPTFGRHRISPSQTFFDLGLGLVSHDDLPGLLWFYENRLHDPTSHLKSIQLPHGAIYAFVHYPLDRSAQNPDSLWEKVTIDRHHGFFTFRNRWQDENDFVASIYTKRLTLNKVWSFPEVGSFRLWGLGNRWAIAGPRDQDWQNENSIYIPHATPWKIGQPTSVSLSDDGSGIVTMQAKQVISRGQQTKELHWQRSFGVDYSGKAGVPGLVIIHDSFTEDVSKNVFSGKTWLMHTSGEVSLEERAFSIQGKNGASLHGYFVEPSTVTLEYKATATGGVIKAKGSNEYLVLMTVQTTSPPTVKVDQQGANWTLNVGEQIIQVDSEGIKISGIEAVKIE
ncbi:MAG: hypothetical protein AAGG02_04670 [Cyanobacteria bacterium P01_H01_bin.15]